MDAIGKILLENFKRSHFNLDDHKSIAKFHRKIFECIKKKDTQKIGDIMSIHLKDVKERLKI